MRGSVEKVDRGVGRRAAASKAKFTYSSHSDDDDEDDDGPKAGSSRNSRNGDDVETFDIKVRDSLSLNDCIGTNTGE